MAEPDDSRSFDATHTWSADEGDEEQHATVLGVTVREPDTKLKVGRLLGAGGMGEVREAEQQTLARTVAVKSLNPEVANRLTRRRLLQEAWTTGGLEHPNIVPIHDIDFETGEPRIVMKAVEGVSWVDVMGNPGATFEVDDPFEWNVRVLMSVCNAIDFAHSRGILHRDLKPENVMVGRYGEVYVVDWGIAVALRPREDGRIPTAADQKRAAGTPAYMAPEMLTGRGELLTEKTDIYLLGGLLYALVTGFPPRMADSLDAILDKVAYEDVEIDPEWPLADLLASALSRDPDDRPASAMAFRRSLQAHLDRRDAIQLAESGRERASAMRQALADGSERRAIYDHYSAARFAFEEAERRWAGSLNRETDRDALILELARHEVEREDDRAAQLLLDQLDAPPSELVATVEAMAEARRTAAERLEKLQADVDPRTAMVPRLVVAFGLSISWVVAPMGTGILGISKGYAREFAVSGGIFVITLGVMAVLWPWFLRSRLNRSLLAVFLLMPLLALTFLFACWLAGLPASIAAALELHTYLMLLVITAAMLDWRMIFSIPFYVAALWIGAWAPDWSLTLLGIANGFVGINAIWVLTRPAFGRAT